MVVGLWILSGIKKIFFEKFENFFNKIFEIVIFYQGRQISHGKFPRGEKKFFSHLSRKFSMAVLPTLVKNHVFKNFVKKIFKIFKNFFFIPLSFQRPTTMQNFRFLSQSYPELWPFFSFGQNPLDFCQKK